MFQCLFCGAVFDLAESGTSAPFHTDAACVLACKGTGIPCISVTEGEEGEAAARIEYED